MVREDRKKQSLKEGQTHTTCATGSNASHKSKDKGMGISGAFTAGLSKNGADGALNAGLYLSELSDQLDVTLKSLKSASCPFISHSGRASVTG